jgi:hypothetical protein
MANPLVATNITRLLSILALSTLGLTSARADDLATFNLAVEDAAAHNRAAIGYLHSENVSRANVELGYLRTSWGALSARFGSTPPGPLRGKAQFTQTLLDVPMRAVAADLMLDMGRPDLANNALQAIRMSLSAMRREGGIEVLADCVLDFNKATSALLAFDDAPPDWAHSETTSELAANAEAVGKIARHCDALATESIRKSAEFRKLIDKTAAALARVPKIIEARDTQSLHGVLDELRAYDNLLSLHYG